MVSGVRAVRATALVLGVLASGPAWALPDLVVTDITLDPAVPHIEQGKLTATIKNQGDEGTGVFTNINIKMYLDGVECDTGLIIAGLGKGSTATEDTTSCNPSTPGPHVIRFEVDTDSDVDESNEGNNALEKTFTWAGGPDLVVTDIVLDPASPDVGEGKLTATLKNQGEDGTGTFVNVDITMYLDGVECDTGILIAGLGAGSEATEDSTSCNPDTPGPHTIRFEIDSTHEIAESDEANNTLEKTFIWVGADLVITDIALDPAVPGIGDGTLTATVANQGPYGTGTFVNINLKMFLDGEECDTGLILAGLGAGATATEETTSCNPSTPGEHTIRFEVDTDGDVAETDETNNSLEKKFTWTAPDLVVTGITMDPEKPVPGDKVKFTATLKNQGTVDTDCVVINLQFFLDDATEPCDDGLILCGLDAGGETTDDTTSCSPKDGGPHTLTVVVDTDEDVVETDESNNSFAQTFTICAEKELCNGQDDTCDGKTDEGFSGIGEPCDGADADQCLDGKKACAEDGKSVTCVDDAESLQEACNGADDDCDGKSDEDFAGLGGPCTVDVGGCAKPGTKVCAADGAGTTCQALPATADTCNAKDDDCDGQTDEDQPELGQPCAAGEGACRVVGQFACGGGKAVVCDAKPPAGAASDTCGNLVDDDCDGATDEGCACVPGTYLPCGSGVGECQPGLQACTGGGTWGEACEGAVGPKTDACNGKDDDCDGTVDPGCSCKDGDTRDCAPGAGACAAGEQHCTGGAWGPCVAAAVGADTDCNGVDDDCDGATDEGCPCTPGATVPCAPPEDACGEYERACAADGTFGPCAIKAGTEIPGCGEPADEDTGSPEPDAGSVGGDTTPGGSDAGSGADAGGLPSVDGDAVGSADANPKAPEIVESDSGCSTTARPAQGALLLLLIAALALARRRRAVR